MGNRKNGIRNVPAPPGSKAGLSYSRFIPREELGSVTSWQPGAFGERRQAPRDTAAPAAPAPAGAVSEQEWRERMATARAQGYQDGYRDGLAALESFKASFATQATAQIGALIEGLDTQFAALDQRIAASVAQLAVQLARQVLRSELQQHPAVVASVASEAVNAVMLSARHLTVHVHPDDLPLVAEGADEALRGRGARLLPDPTLERGGVRVESDAGTVDARIEQRWAAACAALGHDLPWDGAETVT
jgi:flagellar assembly protein FliH